MRLCITGAGPKGLSTLLATQLEEAVLTLGYGTRETRRPQAHDASQANEIKNLFGLSVFSDSQDFLL